MQLIILLANCVGRIIETTIRANTPFTLGNLEKVVESNVATSKGEEKWDAEALFAFDKEDFSFTATTSSQVDFEKDWIVDSGCSNHMTGDVEKL